MWSLSGPVSVVANLHLVLMYGSGDICHFSVFPPVTDTVCFRQWKIRDRWPSISVLSPLVESCFFHHIKVQGECGWFSYTLPRVANLSFSCAGFGEQAGCFRFSFFTPDTGTSCILCSWHDCPPCAQSVSGTIDLWKGSTSESKSSLMSQALGF